MQRYIHIKNKALNFEAFKFLESKQNIFKKLILLFKQNKEKNIVQLETKKL